VAWNDRSTATVYQSLRWTQWTHFVNIIHFHKFSRWFHNYGTLRINSHKNSVVLYSFRNRSPNVKGIHISNTFGKRVLRIYAYIPRDRKQRERWKKKLRNEELHILYSSPDTQCLPERSREDSSLDMPANAGFLYEKASVLRKNHKKTSCIIKAIK
jgi:hypothetical protein